MAEVIRRSRRIRTSDRDLVRPIWITAIRLLNPTTQQVGKLVVSLNPNRGLSGQLSPVVRRSGDGEGP